MTLTRASKAFPTRYPILNLVSEVYSENAFHVCRCGLACIMDAGMPAKVDGYIFKMVRNLTEQEMFKAIQCNSVKGVLYLWINSG